MGTIYSTAGIHSTQKHAMNLRNIAFFLYNHVQFLPSVDTGESTGGGGHMDKSFPG